MSFQSRTQPQSLFNCALLLALLLLGPVQAFSTDIRIGAILQLSGETAPFGSAMQNGIRLALEESEHTAQLFVEDEGVMDRAKAMSAFQKLTDVDKVDVVLGSIVQMAAVYGPVANRIRVPVLVIWDDNEQIAGLGDYVFGLGYSTERAGKLMAEFAHRNLKFRRVASIAMQDEWSEITTRAFRARYKELGGELVLEQSVSPEETDHRTFITRTKSLNADGIYIPLYLQCLESFIKQARILRYEGKLLGGDTVFEDTLKRLGSDTEGMYLTNIYLDNKPFRERYSARFKSESSPMLLGLAATGYDVTNIVLTAARSLAQEGKDVNGQNLRDRLVGLNWKGVTGSFQIGTDRSAGRDEKLLEVRGGKFSPVQQETSVE